MFTYFDPISIENLPISEDIFLYIINLNSKYYIKGVSLGLDQLVADPSAKAKNYWLITNINEFIQKVEKEELVSEIFPGDHLTSEELSLDIIKSCVGFDPTTIKPRSFNEKLENSLSKNGVKV